MTIAFRRGEDWSVTDGAPDGVSFDLTVYSASEPDKPYRIARQGTSHGLEGYIVHTPACRAWREGNRSCWHVRRALEWAEDPLRRFALDVIEGWPMVCMSPELQPKFAAAMFQSAEQAIHQAQALDEYEDRQREPKVTAAQAVAEFDRGDPRERAA